MSDAAIYILSGIALYGGIRQLYLSGFGSQRHPHVLHAVLFFLLIALALGHLSILAPDAASQTGLAKLVVASVIVTWMLFAWFVSSCTGTMSQSALAVLTIGWCLLLIINVASARGLMFTGAESGLGSGRWWSVVQFSMLVTLLIALLANLKFARQDVSGNSILLSGGLFILMASTVLDFFVSAGMIESTSLQPFGFLAFLLLSGLYAGTPPVAPARLHDGSENEALQVVDTPQVLEAGSADKAVLTGEGEIIDSCTASLPQPMRERLIDLSDQLVDVAVNAKMVIKRYRRGDTDPEEMEALCEKVSNGAIQTHRLANQLSNPEKRQWP